MLERKKRYLSNDVAWRMILSDTKTIINMLQSLISVACQQLDILKSAREELDNEKEVII